VIAFCEKVPGLFSASENKPGTFSWAPFPGPTDVDTVAEVFKEPITDAETLLRHFNDLNTHPPPPDIEALKRAGLTMAMTAWRAAQSSAVTCT
jgi:hypothetical protein